MADETEVTKYIIDYVNSAADTGELAKKLEVLKTAAESVGGPAGAFIQVIAKSAELGVSLKHVAAETKESGEKTKLSLGELAAGGQTLFSAFSSGNVGASIKGVLDLVALIPVVGSFASQIKMAGTVAEASWPLLKEWFSFVSEASDKAAAAAKNTGDFVKTLHDANQELKTSEAMTAAGAADAEAAATPSSRAKARGGMYGDLTKGREKDSIKEIFDALREEHGGDDSKTEKQIQAIKDKYAGYRKEALARNPLAEEGALGAAMKLAREQAERAEVDPLVKAYTESRAKDQAAAEAMHAKARTGDAGALQEIQDTVPRFATTHEVARMASPEGMDEQRQSQRWSAEQGHRSREWDKEQAALRHHDEAIEEGMAREKQSEVLAAREKAKRDAEHEAHAQKALAEKSDRDAEHARAEYLRRGPVDEYAQRIGRENQRTGAGLNDSMIRQAAEATVDLNRAGLSVDQALTEAMQRSIAKMQHLQMEYEATAARIRNQFSGPDMTGQFSQISPMWGGG